jgi:hypothetical protein
LAGPPDPRGVFPKPPRPAGPKPVRRASWDAGGKRGVAFLVRRWTGACRPVRLGPVEGDCNTQTLTRSRVRNESGEPANVPVTWASNAAFRLSPRSPIRHRPFRGRQTDQQTEQNGPARDGPLFFSGGLRPPRAPRRPAGRRIHPTPSSSTEGARPHPTRHIEPALKHKPYIERKKKVRKEFNPFKGQTNL